VLLERLGASWTTLAVVVLSGLGVYVAVIALTRLAGVRSLAKMSSFDFAATVAVGSTIATTLVGSTSLTAGVFGLAVLFGLQYLVATLRRRGLLLGVVDNEPLLLMADGQVLEGNLRHARVSREELFSQLRQHGIFTRAEVQAVVLETTGDVSVVRTGQPVDDDLLRGVRGSERLR
jgi:uncharacterized membrane protein YcaP (DUF421 family)